MNRIDSGLFTVSEFRNRGVVKLAPDALVYISGSLGSAVVAPVAGGSQTTSFNDGITSVSVQNNIDPPGSSNASIEVTTPIYGEHSRYWLPFDDPVTGRRHRVPIFQPMTEVKIFYKGRFLVRNGERMETKYYPAFWGFITDVEENFSGGVWKISIQCADMLHWWEYSQLNIHPVPASNIAAGGGLTLTAFSTIFKDANPYTILYSLTQDMGMHEMVVPTFVGELTPLNQQYPPQALKEVMTGRVMAYWRSRFGNMASLLKMYGLNGQQINGEPVKGPDGKIRQIFKPEKRRAQEQQGTSNSKDASMSRPRGDFVASNDYLMGYNVFFDFDQMGTFDDAEYMSKLTIATEIKNRVDFEFFQDVNGNWIFKPPFYNLNTKSLLPYNIKSHDVISNSFSTQSEGIVTVMEIQLPMHPQLKGDGAAPPHKGFHMDPELAARYGIRYKRQNLEYLVKNNSKVGNQMAVAYMALNNAKAFTGSVTIPGRPELRLGYPIYLEHRDSFHYVKSINHAFDYGGSFTTTLSLEAERKRLYQFKDDDWGPPLKDYINKYQGPAAIGDITINPEDKDYPQSLNDFTEQARKLQVDAGRLSTIQQGRYKLEPRDPQDTAALAVTNTSIPVTDEEGYRVIGGFRYGRGVLVTGGTTMDVKDVQNLNYLTSPETLVSDRNNYTIANMKTTNYEYEAAKMSEALRDAGSNEGPIPAPLDVFRIDGGSDSKASPLRDTLSEKNAEATARMKPGTDQGPEQDASKTVSGVKKSSGAEYTPGPKTQQEHQRQQESQ